jgi:CBS domain-containing protein
MKNGTPSDAPPSDSGLALPIKHLVKGPPLSVKPDATVAEAASAMQSARVGSLLVAGDPPGIVTDRDLRGRVLAAGLSADTPVREVMTQPLKTLDSGAPILAALQLMLQENIHHLALVEEGKIVGVVSGTDLLHYQASSPLYLRRILDNLRDPAMLPHYSAEIGATVQTLFNGGLGAVQIGRIVSSLNDALVNRLAALAEEALGAPPSPFAWVVLGSEGRSEQTLLTDQDNALVYEDDSGEARAYFAALAQRVVDGLIEVGFPHCPGGFMATRWCKPLPEWRRLFSQWIETPEPQALLDAAVFFDFRPVAGGLSLAPLEEILAGASAEKVFIARTTQAALDFQPPLGFFSRIRTDGGMLDIKKGGIGPVVNLARAGALAAGSRTRSTLERLRIAGRHGEILNEQDAQVLAEVFQFLLQIRLREQLAALRAKRPADHKIRVAGLSVLERRHLKEALVTIRDVQDDIRLRFPIGGMG